MIRLGGALCTHSQDPWEIARQHKQFGFRAAFCPPVDLADAPRIAEIARAFQQEDVVISEVQAFYNVIGPDEKERRRNRERVAEHLALADDIGALCCIGFTGSVDPRPLPYEPHPDNVTERGFELAVEAVRDIIDAVKPKRAKYCLEMMQWTLPDSPESALELIRAVDRQAFAAHIDPVNVILTPRQYFNNGEVIRRCFALLGPWIIGCHAKDIRMRNTLALHLDEVIVGQGQLDYATYLRALDQLPGEIPLMLEHLNTPEEYAEARDHLFAVGRREQIAFAGRREEERT